MVLATYFCRPTVLCGWFCQYHHGPFIFPGHSTSTQYWLGQSGSKGQVYLCFSISPRYWTNDQMVFLGRHTKPRYNLMGNPWGYSNSMRNQIAWIYRLLISVSPHKCISLTDPIVNNKVLLNVWSRSFPSIG